MANKFQKSVEERLRAEAQRQNTVEKAPLQKNEELPSRSGVVQKRREGPKLTDKSIQENKGKKHASADPGTTQPDLRTYVSRPINRAAKNKTFYLDEDVIQAIKRHASEQKMTESRLVNEILRQILAL